MVFILYVHLQPQKALIGSVNQSEALYLPPPPFIFCFVLIESPLVVEITYCVFKGAVSKKTWFEFDKCKFKTLYLEQLSGRNLKTSNIHKYIWILGR